MTNVNHYDCLNKTKITAEQGAERRSTYMFLFCNVRIYIFIFFLILLFFELMFAAR